MGIYHHNDSSAAVGTFNKEFINALPSSVRYIVHNGAGYDQSEYEPVPTVLVLYEYEYSRYCTILEVTAHAGS